MAHLAWAIQGKRHRVEDILRLHHGESAQWYALHWRDQRSHPTLMGASRRPHSWLHQEIRRQDPGVLRTFRQHSQRHSSREPTQEIYPQTQARTDREHQSALGRSDFEPVTLDGPRE